MPLGQLLHLGAVGPGFWAFLPSGLLISGLSSLGLTLPPPQLPISSQRCSGSRLLHCHLPDTPGLTSQTPLAEPEARSPGLWWGFPVGLRSACWLVTQCWALCFRLEALLPRRPSPAGPGCRMGLSLGHRGPGGTDRESDREAEREEGRGEGKEERDSTGSEGQLRASPVT